MNKLGSNKLTFVLLVIGGVILFIIFLITLNKILLPNLSILPDTSSGRSEIYKTPEGEEIYYNPDEIRREQLEKIIKEDKQHRVID